MKLIQFLQATNVITRHRQRIQQDLTFAMVVENIAYDKTVEVQWAGEDKVWHTLRAEFLTACDANREIWCARTSVVASDNASLPGDIEFVLHCRIRGQEVWDNNGSRNYFSSADSGVLLQNDVPLLDIDFNPLLAPDQRYYPITVAVRHSVQPEHVFVHWTTDDWRTTRVTPCFFHTLFWDKQVKSNARNPNRDFIGIWSGQLKIDDAFRVQYAIGCKTPGGTIWDCNFGRNYVTHRRRLKILTLNLHCYQEANQDAKFSQIARAIDDLDVDVVCLQEVGEPWGNGSGDWNANAAKIIRDRLRQYYHLHTDWSHIGFDRYREGIAVLSRYGFLTTDAGYVSSAQTVHDINSRKVVMVQVNVPYIGLVNVFSAHLSWPSGGFLEQFERLRAWANHKHGGNIAATFLCGDFNIKAGSDAYQSVVYTREYEDQYLAATSRNVFDEIYRQYSSNIEQRLAMDGRIDYIFMQRNSSLQAVAARELFTDYDQYGRVSDHTGYCVEFEPH